VTEESADVKKHQWAAVIMAGVVTAVSFTPVLIHKDNFNFFLMQRGWMYPVIGAGIAAVLVVAAFWPRKND
jgi:hypothetical protein